jgi:hypothetical protein
MSRTVSAFRPAVLVKAICARRFEINPQGELAVAAGLLVLALGMGGGSFVIAMVMWLLYF